MKRLIAFTLVLLIVAQAFSKWMVVFSYNLNKTFITQNFCENKNKPLLKCEGKCQLAKKLASDEKENGTPASLTKNVFSEVLFLEQLPDLFAFQESEKTALILTAINPGVAPYFPAIFHPPLV